MKREYTVLYQPVEDGWIMATVPELPGAVTQGKDLSEARAMIKEAVELLLQSYRENAAKDAPGMPFGKNSRSISPQHEAPRTGSAFGKTELLFGSGRL